MIQSADNNVKNTLVIGSPFEDGVFLRRIEKNRLVDLTLSPPSPLSLSHGERERGVVLSEAEEPG
jgi:hypothetical protein